MPSKKPHVLLDPDMHKVLLKTREQTGEMIPAQLVKIFESSDYFKKLKRRYG